jgi:hypothetical protein
MNYTAQPRLRYALAAALAAYIFALLLTAAVLPIAMYVEPKVFQTSPPFVEVFCSLALSLPVALLPIFLCGFVFARKTSWSFTEEGIDIRNGPRMVRRLPWSEILSIRLARFGASVRTTNKPYIHRLDFVNRNDLLPYIPEEKRRLIAAI